MTNRDFDNSFCGQSIIEYTLLLAAITLLTVFTSQFITQARTDANTHLDKAVGTEQDTNGILGPGHWPANVEPIVPYSETEAPQ